MSTIVQCDRCAHQTPNFYRRLVVESGYRALDEPSEIDLCLPCFSAVLGFLREGANPGEGSS